MKPKYAVILLALILCLSFTACSDKEKSEFGESANVFQSSDGKYEITAPLGWEDVTNESAEASILSIQKNSVSYMAMAAHKPSADLEQYTLNVAEALERSMVTEGEVTVGQPEEFTVSGGKGYKIVITNEVEDAELCSSIYCIDLEGTYIQINCVYAKSIQPEMAQEYDGIIKTLRSVK